MVGVALKVTLVPWQTEPEGAAAMLTETADGAVTAAVTVFEVAGLPEVQVRLEVNTQLTRSLLAGT